MRVKLLKDVIQGGQVKQAKRGRFAEKFSADGTPLAKDYEANPSHADVSFVRGVEVDVSDATGQKWIAQGLAEQVMPIVKEVAS